MTTCDKCNATIEPGEERELHGRVLCEDCYMDALSPPRTCDPWAVYTAKSLADTGTGAELTAIQKKILDILKETGGIEKKALAERLDMKPSDLEREIAALRHMEKLRGEKRGDTVVVCLW